MAEMKEKAATTSSCSDARVAGSLRRKKSPALPQTIFRPLTSPRGSFQHVDEGQARFPNGTGASSPSSV